MFCIYTFGIGRSTREAECDPRSRGCIVQKRPRSVGLVRGGGVVGGGRKKINLRQEVAVKGRGGAQGAREVEKECREAAELGPGRVPASPVILCLHTEKFRTISQLPFQPPLKRGQIPSWLLTLYPARGVAIMGKSKPLASPVGYLSPLCYSFSANSRPP